jgi:hypothetical protein
MSQISEDLLQFINSLQRRHRDKVRKIFSLHRFDPNEPQAINCIGLKITYLQPLPKAEVAYQLQRFAHQNNSSITDAVIERIYELSQGIAGIMKSLLETYLLTGEVNAHDHESEIYLNMIANCLNELDRISVISNSFQEGSYCQLVGLDRSEPILTWLRNAYAARREHVLAMNLTPIQMQIYLFLRANQGRLIMRDEIAKLIWGDNYLEKYSDWAIDRHMSDLRKALMGLAQIKTKKGQGFIFK